MGIKGIDRVNKADNNEKRSRLKSIRGGFFVFIGIDREVAIVVLCVGSCSHSK